MVQELVTQNVNDVVQKQHNSFSDHIADTIATVAGHMGFVYAHTVWFALWFAFHLDINLLTLIVSLEAIYLSTFIMINQNQQTEKDRIEAQLDYQVNKRAELEINDMQKDLFNLQQRLDKAQFDVLHNHLEDIKRVLGLKVTTIAEDLAKE